MGRGYTQCYSIRMGEVNDPNCILYDDQNVDD